jgi:hypothetical protein
MRISWIPFSVLALACYAYYDVPNPDEGISVEMMSHSFSSPFQYDSSSANWYLAGATIPVKNYRSSVILNPHILNRHGYLMNKKLLKSRNFDATFMVHMDNGGIRSNQNQSPPRDQTFSIWFTEQDMSTMVESALTRDLQSDSPDYKKVLTSARMDVMTGISARFKGVGIVITPTNSRGEAIPTVYIVESNGRNDVIGSAMFPSPSGTPLFPETSSTASLVHQLVYIRMRIKIRPDSIGLYMQDRADWRVVKEIKTTNIPSLNGGGYFGITAFTGSSVPTDQVTPYRVRITSAHIKTFDLNALNTEENASVLKLFTDQGLSISDLVSDSAFATTYSQTMVLTKLMRVVDGYIKQSAPVLKSFEKTISQTLMDKMNDLDGQVNVLSRETKLAFKDRPSNGGAGTELLSQVKSIHDALKKSHDTKLDVLEKIKSTATIEDTGSSIDRHVGYYERQMDSRNRELNEAIESQNRFTLILFLIVFVSALVMGIVFYIRLNAYAKKAHLF